jgi:hypothetical protein
MARWARTIADTRRDPEAKRIMLQIAAHYSALAVRAQ